MNRIKSMFLFLALLVFLFPSLEVSAITNAKTVYITEESYVVEHQDQAMLLNGPLLTYQQVSYLPLRDAANLFNLTLTSQANGIHLNGENTPPVIQSILSSPLPKETVRSNDHIQFSLAIGGHAGAVLEGGHTTPSFMKNANAPLYPASTVKVMTALLALEKGNLNDLVIVGPGAATVPSDSSKAGVNPGDVMTLEQLLHGLMLPSGNDAAVAIAEHIAGTHWQFVQMMNQRAREIGALNTTFMNAHGYDHTSQKTTASDLAKIGAEAAKHPFFMKLVSTPTYATTYRSRSGSPVHKVWRNTNDMVHPASSYRHPLVTGGKTGYTSISRHNLISFAEFEGSTFTTVILRGDRTQRYRDTAGLVNRATQLRGQFDRANKKQAYIQPVTQPIFVNGQEIAAKHTLLHNGTTYISVDDMRTISKAISTVHLTAEQRIQAAVSGNLLTFDRVDPTITSGRMLVPIRPIFEHLGLELDWNQATRTAIGKSGDTTITLRINEKTAQVNGVNHTLDVPATVVNGRTVVPVRFVTEATGQTIDWGRARVITLD